VSTGDPEQRALRPLWMLTTGVTAGCGVMIAGVTPGAAPLAWCLLALGTLALWLALGRRGGWVLWLAAGLALGGARGDVARAERTALDRTIRRPDAVARATMTVVEGWSKSRWGWRSRVRARQIRAGDGPLTVASTCRLEVRGAVSPLHLPAPGATVAGLVAVRGRALDPLLVASSPKLLEEVRPPHGLPHLRDLLGRRLLAAAGVDAHRIRAAELAGAVVLGRRDLLPEDRRAGWRRSGLAHLLAVSGLHVGLVAGAAWLVLSVCGVPPRTARIVLLAVLPGYALLAGAAPSALRAALMGMVYLGARLLGRAVLPMAAVLLTATVLLLARPALVVDAGFQLTVLITAALIRWTPALTAAIPAPRWLAATVAVPVVAQLAAAPVVALHFRTLVPGAVLANLLVPILLTPTLLAALLVAALAPWWPAAAGLGLDLVGVGRGALWLTGAAGRALAATTPAPPLTALVAYTLLGWAALRPGSRARWAAVGWLATMALVPLWWWVRPQPPSPAVTLLPVSDGLAVVVDSGRGRVLMDGGRWPRQTNRLLADHHLGRLDVVLASHADEDHIGALATVLEGARARTLAFPAWMASEPAVVPLLRAARRRGATEVAVAAGSVIDAGGMRVEALWPSPGGRPTDENERSLVARLRLPEGIVLLTADIGRRTERALGARSRLRCDVLLVPHHGSRESTSPSLLAAAEPDVALIPAGPDNLYHHPHPEALARLQARRIPLRFPARDGLCGAVFRDHRWIPVP